MESLEPNIARKCCFCSKAVIGLEFSGLHLPWAWCGTGCTPWIQIVLTLIVLQVPRLPWVVTQTTLQTWQWHWWNAVWVQCYMYSLEPIPFGEKRVLSLSISNVIRFRVLPNVHSVWGSLLLIFFSVMSLVSESLFVKTEVKQQCNVEPLQEERLDVNNIRIPFFPFF